MFHPCVVGLQIQMDDCLIQRLLLGTQPTRLRTCVSAQTDHTARLITLQDQRQTSAFIWQIPRIHTGKTPSLASPSKCDKQVLTVRHGLELI